MSTVPWGKPPAASFEFGLADHDGTLAFFIVGGLHQSVSTSFGERDAIRCSIIMLDGKEAGNEYSDILIFNSRPVARLRNVEGGSGIVLARIAIVQGKGANPPVELMEATPADEALAGRYHQHFPLKLRSLLGATITSYQMNEAKARQGNGRVQSQPHPTHAGSRAAINQPQFGQQPQEAPPWATSPTEPQTPAPDPWAKSPTLGSMVPQPGGLSPDPWADRSNPAPY
jgi:hypothetical protein